MTSEQPRRITIEDVARHAGVSRAAVSKVLNGRKGISVATAERIRASAHALDWQPQAAAAALRRARSRTVGMVMRRDPDLLVVDPHFAVMVAGVEEVLRTRGYGLQLHLVGESTEAEEEAYRRLSSQRQVDGVIASEIRIDDPRPELFDALGLPAVFLGVSITAASDAVHSASPSSGMQEAADHLVAAGHRRIAYVAGPADRVAQQLRLRWFTERLSAHGVALAQTVTTSYREEEAAEVAVALVERAEVTAIVLANDTMAIAAIGALQRRGRRVPEEVSIVGHDDLPLASWVYPGLTTVSQDLEHLAMAGTARLLRALGEEDVAEIAIEPPRLVVRDSVRSATG